MNTFVPSIDKEKTEFEQTNNPKRSIIVIESVEFGKKTKFLRCIFILKHSFLHKIIAALSFIKEKKKKKKHAVQCSHITAIGIGIAIASTIFVLHQIKDDIIFLRDDFNGFFFICIIEENLLKYSQ